MAQLCSIKTCQNGKQTRWQIWKGVSVISLCTSLWPHGHTFAVHLITILTRVSSDQFSHVLVFLFCFWNGTFCFCLVVGCQCFGKQRSSTRTCQNGIRARWQPCKAVSVISLTLCVLTTPSVFNTTTQEFEFHQITQFSHVVFSFVFGMEFFCWIFFFFSCIVTFAVFYGLVEFNSDVSKWNTGAVTSMERSECTLSSSPWPHVWPRLPPLCC